DSSTRLDESARPPPTLHSGRFVDERAGERSDIRDTRREHRRSTRALECRARQRLCEALERRMRPPQLGFQPCRMTSVLDLFSALPAKKGPMASTSILVRWKQSIASCGVHTIGSFSLKLVFRITGVPVFLPNAWIRS